VDEWCLWKQSFRDLLDIDPESKKPEPEDMMERFVKNLLLVLSGYQKMMDFHNFEAE
jgi:hypothetical protein